MRVLFAGAHPDDIESCAGGTMAKLAALGHEVHGLSFTDGQVGYYKGDKTPCEVGAMRRREMLAASAILGYTPHFSGHWTARCARERGRSNRFSPSSTN